MSTKHIAVVANNQPNLAEAMKQRLITQYGDKVIVSVVPKQSDRPAGAELATLGLPNYVGGTEPVVVHNFGTKFVRDATPAQQRAQWEVVRPDENGQEHSVEEIIAVLADASIFTITPKAAEAARNTAILEARLKIAETEDKDEQLAAYKELVSVLA